MWQCEIENKNEIDGLRFYSKKQQKNTHTHHCFGMSWYEIVRLDLNLIASHRKILFLFAHWSYGFLCTIFNERDGFNTKKKRFENYSNMLISRYVQCLSWIRMNERNCIICVFGSMQKILRESIENEITTIEVYCRYLLSLLLLYFFNFADIFLTLFLSLSLSHSCFLPFLITVIDSHQLFGSLAFT